MRLAGTNTDEYRLRIGAVTVSLRLRPRRYQAFLAEYFRRPSAAAAPDFRLTVRVVGDPPNRHVPDSLFHGKGAKGARFWIAAGMVRGRLLPGGCGAALRVPAMLLDGQVVRVFEQLLYQAFYAAAQTSGHDAFLLHASGVIRQGGAWLFVGPSGSGKSTVAGLSMGFQVLNDEICQVQLAGQTGQTGGQSGTVTASDTPFNGFFQGKVEASAPLRGLFLLQPGQSHRVSDVPRAEAVGAIFQQIVPPVAPHEQIDARTHSRMLEIADRLTRAVPVRRLEFRKDAGFWTEIDRAAEKGDPA